MGSAACFSGPQYTIPQLCYRSAQYAITQCFQICQCAMRNAAIADTSATHNLSKEKIKLNIWWLMPLFLFYLFLVSYSVVATSTLDIHYFAWGLLCGVSWGLLKACLQWSWAVVIELRLKSVEDMCLCPTGTRTHVSHIRGSNSPVSECPPAFKIKNHFYENKK